MDCRSGDLSCVKNYRKVGKSKTIEGEKMLKKKKIYILMSLVIAVILFCILFFSGKIHYGESILKYQDADAYSLFSNRELKINPSDEIQQQLLLDEGVLNSFAIKYHLENFEEGTIFSISLNDTETGETIQNWEENGAEIEATGYREYYITNEKINSEKEVYLKISSNKVTKALWCSEGDSLKGANFEINGERQDGDIILKLFQKKYVTSTIGFSIVVCLVFGLFCSYLLLFFKWKKVRNIICLILQYVKYNNKKIFFDMVGIFFIGIIGIVIEKKLSASNILEYNTIGAFNEYRYAFIVVALLCIFIFIRKREWLKKKPERIFSTIMLLIGMLYVIAIPAEAELSWDEGIHYWKAVGVSHGLCGATNAADDWIYWHSGTGYTLPNTIDTLRIIQNNMQAQYNANNIVSANTDILTQMNGVSYVPSAIGLVIGRKIGLSYALTFQLGAAMNMLLYIVLIYFAMKKLKSGKMILAVASTLVTAFFLAAVYSTDSWITGFVFLGSAYFIGNMQSEEKIIQKDLYVMSISYTLAFMAKAIYFPLFGLYLLIPKEKFESEKQCERFKITIIDLIFTFLLEMVLSFKWFIPIFIIGWLGIYVITKIIKRLSGKQRIILAIVMSGIVLISLIGGIIFVLPKLVGAGDFRGGTDVNSGKQVKFIINNPVQYTKILFMYLTGNYLAFQGALQVIFNTFGYMGQATLHIVAFVMLWIVAMTDKNKNDMWRRYNIVKLSSILICSIIIVLMATALYVSFTPVGSGVINGCQPRYLIPLILIFFSLIGSNKIENKIPQSVYNGMVISGVSVILMVSIWQVVIRMYA